MQAHCAKGFSKNIELHVLVKNVRYPPADLNTCPNLPQNRLYSDYKSRS